MIGFTIDRFGFSVMCEEKNGFSDSLCTNKPITIRALRRQTRKVISDLLNPERYIPSEKGLQRDWQGLAELCGISGEKIPSLWQSNDPSNKVLEIWMENNKDDSTIDKLFLFFEDLDRFDIISEITPLLAQDIDYFNENANGLDDSLCTEDGNLLTKQDIERKTKELPLQIYDAFVLFADDDNDFATELVKILQDEYNLNLFVKDDLIGGTIEHDSVIQLISRRCRRLVVIVSPSFFQIPVHKYLFGFAQVEGIEQKRRKIIPCLIKSCDNLPRDFGMYVSLNFAKHGKNDYNFYDKLFHSIKSNENQCLSSAKQIPETSTKTLKQNKFNSMVNINNSMPIIPLKEENPSTSALNNLESDIGVIKKKNSIYKKVKKALQNHWKA